ncbi:MAG: hypothetical protein B7X46_04120 [Thiomonas sp. 15-66-11]|nr:MAG: hypothetical protein B7X46_04120 [Thiomonas sp. 15-66-11]
MKLGWSIKRLTGSHGALTRAGWTDFTFAFHDGDEIGPRMLARVAQHTGLTPDFFRFSESTRPRPVSPIPGNICRRAMPCRRRS